MEEVRLPRETYHVGASGRICFNPAARTIGWNKRTVTLTKHEALLLYSLTLNCQRIVSREELAWFLRSDAITEFVYSARKRLRAISGRLLVTHHYDGYSVRVPDARYQVVFQLGSTSYYPTVRRLAKGRKETYLTPIENHLLWELAKNRSACVPKSELYRVCLEQGGTPGPKMIDVVICRIRGILTEFERHRTDHIRTENPGRGYLLL
jgi:DNA-binding response OmpR family regulator